MNFAMNVVVCSVPDSGVISSSHRSLETSRDTERPRARTAVDSAGDSAIVLLVHVGVQLRSLVLLLKRC